MALRLAKHLELLQGWPPEQQAVSRLSASKQQAVEPSSLSEDCPAFGALTHLTLKPARWDCSLGCSLQTSEQPAGTREHSLECSETMASALHPH